MNTVKKGKEFVIIFKKENEAEFTEHEEVFISKTQAVKSAKVMRPFVTKLLIVQKTFFELVE